MDLPSLLHDLLLPLAIQLAKLGVDLYREHRKDRRDRKDQKEGVQPPSRQESGQEDETSS